MFIAAGDIPTRRSFRCVMSSVLYFAPKGASNSFTRYFYKHFAPNGAKHTGRLLLRSDPVLTVANLGVPQAYSKDPSNSRNLGEVMSRSSAPAISKFASRLFAAFACFIALLLLGGAVQAQEDVIRTETSLVQLNIGVVD